MSRSGLSKAAVACVGALMLGGCADSYFVSESGEKGIPFYRPRPYIVVLEPFPVAAEHVLVPGTVRPDGTVMHIDPEAATALQRIGVHMPSSFTPHTNQTINLFLPSAKPGDSRLTSGGPAVNTAESLLSRDQTTAIIDDIINAGKTVDKDSAPDGGTASGWVKKGDLTEFRDPVNNLFEIRYLPDMDETYRLVGKAGLGQASLDAYLMRGWSAQHLGTVVDRRDLGKAVFGNIQAVLDIARAAGKAALIVSTGGTGALATLTSGGDVPQAEREATVQPVMLQVTVMEYAVPGVYPILKKSEMREVTRTVTYPQTTRTVTAGGFTIEETLQEGSYQLTNYDLPITGSNQQPASAALPVAYRTQKQLIVALAGSVGEASKPGGRAVVGLDQLREKVDGIVKSITDWATYVEAVNDDGIMVVVKFKSGVDALSPAYKTFREALNRKYIDLPPDEQRRVRFDQ